MSAYREADRLIRRGAELSAAGAPDAQEALERAVLLAPEDPDILTRAAGLSFDNERFDRARELLARAYDLATPEFDLAPTMAYLGGLLALRDGRRDEALEVFRGAFDAEPWQEGFGYQLAIQLLRAGRTADAHSVVTRAIEAGAEDDDLPRLRDHLEKVAEAEQAYAERATPEAVMTLADTLEVFDPERARELFEGVLQDGDDHQRARAAFNLGSLLSDRDRAVAQRYYEQALAGQDPLFRSAAAFNLGGLLRASDPVQARTLFERASESPDAGLAELAREQLAALD